MPSAKRSSYLGDPLAWRMLHVVLAALLRPLGAQQNGAAVLQRRIRALREGGRLEELWRAPVVAPRARTSAPS